MSSQTTFPFERVRPIMLRVIIGALIGAAAVSIISILTGKFENTSWSLVGTAFLFVCFALFTWYDAAVSARRSATFAFTSFAVSVYLFIAGVVLLWMPHASASVGSGYYSNSEPGFESWFGLAFVARIALLHVHLLLTIDAKYQSKLITAVTKVTLVLVVALTFMLSYATVNSSLFSDEGSLFWRVLSIVAILDALGTGLIPLSYSLITHGRRPVTVTGTSDSAGISPVQHFFPAQAAYEPAGTPLLLAWPRYVTGAPLPAGVDGTPDFTGVLGYHEWKAAQL